MLRNYSYLKYIVIPVCILLISVFLRLYKLENRMWWEGDTSRDVLVGYHIAQFHEYPKVGQITSYLNAEAYYPPYYYYLIAFIEYFGDAFFAIHFLIFFESLTPVVVYFICLHISNIIGATLASFSIALSGFMVMSSNVFSAYVPIPIFYIGLLIYLLGRDKRLAIRLLGMSIMIFTIFIHYSFTILVLFIFIYGISIEKTYNHKILFMLTGLAIVVSLCLPLFISINGRGGLIAVSPYNILNLNDGFLNSFTNIVNLILNDIFFGDSHSKLIFLILICIEITISVQTIKKSIYKYYWLISPMFLMPVLGSFFINHPQPYTYTIAVSVLLILLPIIIFQETKLSTLNCMRFLLYLPILWILSNGFTETFYNSDKQYLKAEKIVDTIILDTRQNSIGNSFSIFANTSTSSDINWGRPAYWYILEKKYQIKLVHIIDYDQNIESIDTKSTHTYLICNGDILKRTKCLKNYINAYSDRSLLDLKIESDNTTIFRYVNKNI